MMMKNKILLIIIFCLLSYCVTAKEEIKVISRFYGFNHVGNEIRIQFVEYDIYLGFRVGNIYLMTDKKKFKMTVNKDRKNYMWFIFTRGGCGEVLRVTTPIWALAIYDYETDIIMIVFNLDMFSQDTINHYAIEFSRKYLKNYY